MTDDSCSHNRRKYRKRALDKTGWPDEWADAIIEECLDCDAVIMDHKGRVRVVA